jgi:hypothetical protein
MEIDKFIKVYDDCFEVEKVASLVKYATNKIKFQDAGTIGLDPKKPTVEKTIRNTEVYGFNMDSDSLTSMHWGHYLRRIVSNCFHRYNKEFKTSATVISSVEILKYKEGGFYKIHTDHHASIPRTLSVIIFLNNDYEGGELNFHNVFNDEIYQTIKPSPGRCVMWPSNFIYPHSVSSVTKGTRYAIVSWLT